MRSKIFYGVALGAVIVTMASLLVLAALAANRPAGANPQSAVSTPTPSTAGVLPTQTPAGETNPNSNRIITLISVGQVKATPDVAYLIVGSEVQAGTASDAITKANTSSDAIYKALTEEGISENNIQTFGINVYPVNDTSPKTLPTGPIGYNASFTYYISIYDLSKAGKILDSVTKAGANQISGLNYGIKDDTNYRAQALDKALQLARPKAEAIARNLGAEISQVMTVEEEQVNNYGQSAAYGLGGKGGMGMSIAPGELTVSVQVRISYGLR